ncbi:MAG: SLBB domain-containing protein [Candidatus Dormibacteraeota bacterium]|nr:SLBB domain-containing protein [Candidatus Dormibacteraeota bacterium]
MIDPIEPELAGLQPAGARPAGPRPAGSVRTLELIERSGLRGRGGAGFPTGRKWRAVAERSEGHAVVVANGVEADPMSAKDRHLMTRYPDLVLDGAAVAAESVGAREVVLAVNRRFTDARAVLAAAIRRRRDSIPIRVVDVPARYVAGEESAVIHFINSGVALPTGSPPRPFERGVAGRPTLVQNVETLAWAGLIARRGDGWFRSLGSPLQPGAILCTVAGVVSRPGVVELPAGTTAGEALAAAGGALTSPQALLVGGFFGTWVDPDDARTVGDGGGMVLALPATSCGLAETARMLDILARESAHQCGPCFNGLPALADVMTRVALSRPAEAEVQRLLRWAAQLGGRRGACHHPNGAVGLLLSALRTFDHDLRWHILRGACAGTERPSLLPPFAVGEGWR